MLHVLLFLSTVGLSNAMCSPNPCENGGICTDLGDNYTCACPVTPGCGDPFVLVNSFAEGCELPYSFIESRDECTLAAQSFGYGTANSHSWGNLVRGCGIYTPGLQPYYNTYPSNWRCNDNHEGCLCRSNLPACTPLWQGENCTEDVLECATNPCDPDATCTELPGGFDCTCNTNYEGNGFQCELKQCVNQNAANDWSMDCGVWTAELEL